MFCFMKHFSPVGCAARLQNLEPETGMSVRLLENAGAIVLARANVPQLLSSIDSENFIFGKVLNPWNKKRVAGGSTGGDAALVTSRCVLAGLGSDIGGSIRLPSAFCGVVGLKPSAVRVSSKGHTTLSNTYEGQLAVRVRLTESNK